MVMIVTHVELSGLVLKELRRLPRYIVDKLLLWINTVKSEGMDEVRKIPGYHDKALHGKRKGQRSIRLSKGYRVIYEIYSVGNKYVLKIREVNKHEY